MRVGNEGQGDKGRGRQGEENFIFPCPPFSLSPCPLVSHSPFPIPHSPVKVMTASPEIHTIRGSTYGDSQAAATRSHHRHRLRQPDRRRPLGLLPIRS